MKLTYDPRYNIAYIQLALKTDQVESVRISDELVIDMASDGTIYGIELLNANWQLRPRSEKIDAPLHLTVVNEATGYRAEVPLPVG